MKCSEFHELAAAYALDALPEERRLSCQRHLQEQGPHDGCEALLERYEGVVDALGATVPTALVEPRLWRAIELRLGLPATDPPIPWREALAWAAAASALIGGLWAAQQAQLAYRARAGVEQTLSATNQQLAETQAARAECAAALAELTGRQALGRDAVSLLEDPETKIAPMTSPGRQAYRATALYNAEAKRAVVVSTSVKPVAGKAYQLWVIAAGKAPKPAGFLGFDPNGVALGEFDAQLVRRGRPDALAVSLEPEGGRDAPTDVVLLTRLGT